jgi:hypothetical protein
MNMDLMHLETFLEARADAATREANRHLAEKARHEDEAQINQGVAIFCERASTRVRGLREFLLQAPSGLTIGITATVEAEPAPAPAPVDEPAAGAVAGDAEPVAGAAAVAAADELPARDDPIHDDSAVAETAGPDGDDLPSDAPVGAEGGGGAGPGGAAGEEADAEDKHEAARREIMKLIGDRNDKTDMMKSALATVPGKPKSLSDVPVEYLSGLVLLIQSDLELLQNAPAAEPEPVHAQEPERLVPRHDPVPEADGMTVYDQRLLDVMRMNLDRHGVCGIKPHGLCEIADLDKDVVGASISRLLRARRIVHVSQGTYRVSQRGSSFPPLGEQKAGPAKVAARKPIPRVSEPPKPLQPQAIAALADKLMDLFAQAAANAGDDRAMFGREGLVKRFDVTEYRIDEALEELTRRGQIETVAGLKGHITVRLLKPTETAA